MSSALESVCSSSVTTIISFNNDASGKLFDFIIYV